MQDDRVERQPLVAADRAAASHVLEAVKEAIEPRADRWILAARQHVGALVRGAERARSAVLGKILPECLRPPSRAACSALARSAAVIALNIRFATYFAMSVSIMLYAATRASSGCVNADHGCASGLSTEGNMIRCCS